MAEVLAVVALACAAAACAAAIRTQRTVHRLAKALAREWGLRAGAGPLARHEDEDPPAEHRDASRERSVEALERRLGDVLARVADVERRAAPAAARPATPPAPAAPSAPSDRIREHLVALGYEDVAVLPPRAAGGAFVCEARREGMPAKGSARVSSDGRVEVRWGAPLRAFP
jgi:hypothetical protein